jgi:hypothetical protein
MNFALGDIVEIYFPSVGYKKYQLVLGPNDAGGRTLYFLTLREDLNQILNLICQRFPMIKSSPTGKTVASLPLIIRYNENNTHHSALAQPCRSRGIAQLAGDDRLAQPIEIVSRPSSETRICSRPALWRASSQTVSSAALPAARRSSSASVIDGIAQEMPERRVELFQYVAIDLGRSQVLHEGMSGAQHAPSCSPEDERLALRFDLQLRAGVDHMVVIGGEQGLSAGREISTSAAFTSGSRA